MELVRYKGNPVLTSKDVPFKVNSIFNAGAVKFNGEYLLLCRVEMPTGRSSLVIARSKDGISFKVDEKPCLAPGGHGEFNMFTEWGVEDPRIVKVEDRYLITYTGYSRYQPLVMLAETTDFKNFNVIGPITEPSNKDCAIFPGKINGYYWKMDRPSFDGKNFIWLNKSVDLIHWGGFKYVAEPVPGTWIADKIGGSTPPIRTDKGWLLLFHGVRSFGISTIYKLGVMLLDLEEPWKIIRRSEEPILGPETDYERIGDVQNVVFSNGWIVEDDGSVKVYYSGADTNICLAETTVDNLLSLCR